MKKKILAVVLAAATAFSMFGASLSASAAADYVQVSAADQITAAVAGMDFTTDGGDADYDEYVAAIDAIYGLLVEDFAIPESDEDTAIYAYDYTAKAWNTFKAVLAANAAYGEDDDAAYITIYTNAINAIKTAAATLEASLETGNAYTISATRKEALTAYAAAKAVMAVFNDADYDEVDATEKTALATQYAGDAYATLATSALLFWNARYDAFMDSLVLADGYDAMVALDKAIVAAEKVLENRDLYKTTIAANNAFDKLEKALDEAYALLDDYSISNSKIAAATTKLNGAVGDVAPYSSLASAETKKAYDAIIEEAKFVNTHIDCCYIADMFTGTTAVADFLEVYADYDEDGEVAAAKKYEATALIAIEDLEEVIAALSKKPAAGSAVLKAEEDLAAMKKYGVAVSKLDPSDFTEASWAKLEAELAKYDVAETAHELTAAISAIDGVKLVKLSTRVAKADFAAAKAAAKVVWDAGVKAKHADKSIAAVNAFEAARTAAAAVDASIAPNSVLEAATAAINAAVEAYKDNKVVAAFEGWAYVKGEGWYYYAEGEKVTGWFFDTDYNAWFYMNEDGTMKTGWHWDTEYNAWYFLNANGTMAVSTTTPDGYTVDASGKWVA